MSEEAVEVPAAPADAAPMDDEAAKKAKQKEKERLKKLRQKENKKKEKDEKDEKPKEKKTAVKKPPVAAIKEALKKKQEEEEREKQRIEEEEKRAEELRIQREEKARIEKERKEREKQKKKERIAKQKREGTYLTPEEKERRRRAQAQLELLKAQGLILQGSARGGKEKRDTASPSDEKAAPVAEEKFHKTTKNKPPLQQSTETEAKPEQHPEKLDAGQKSQSGSEPDENVSESEESVADDWEAGLESESEKEPDTAPPVVEDKSSKDDAVNGHVAQKPKIVEKPVEPPSVAPLTSGRPEDPPEKIPQNETKEEARIRIVRRIKSRAKAALSSSQCNPRLRSPVVCVLGHVDTGKTKMLDRIRRSNVQDNEAGGITQQIGATRVPDYTILEQGKCVKDFKPDKLKLPGFLVIDTPGHESFSNLRSRGSSLCDLAILIVDIMHGLEPQTIESINLLRKRGTPFVVALNKVDMLYNWKSDARKDIQALLKSQPQNTQLEFKDRVSLVKQQFQEQGLNVCLYWDNLDTSEYISMVPTSARVGDGVGNLMVHLALFAQENLAERLTFVDHLQCTTLEVKALTGLGMTIDVILVNGRLRVGDTIVVAGYDGPIVTTIRELLMPHPLKELRVKNQYEHHKEVQGAQGIKLLAKDLDKALAGTPLSVAIKEDEVEILCEDVDNYVRKALETFRLKLSPMGVYVQASTLGSLEALLEFLRYCGINIGPVHKKDVMKASTMLEHDAQWAVILAFDVKVEREAEQIADDLGVKIFTADIIYHLEDAFIKHREEQRQREKQRHAHLAVYPCKIRALPQHVFKSRDPIVMGVSVDAGQLKVGTLLCVPSKECIALGSVSSIEINNKPVDIAKAGQEVCIKIENTTGDAPKMYGRHFDHEDVIITRESIDVCKKYFREELTKTDWQLVVELKKMLDIL